MYLQEVIDMLNLVPYSRRHNEASLYNPFQLFDELEKSFFGDKSIAEFKTDIQDKGDHYELMADLPGFKKDDIKIDLDDNCLTISAERHSEYEEKDKKGNFVRCERSFGSYSRSFGVEGIQTDSIKASYSDGVLKLVLPKSAPVVSSTRRLEIE